MKNIVLPIELDGNEVDEDFVEDVIHVLGLDKKKGIIFRHSYPVDSSRG